ncbi:MAG: hypothetical protein NDI95_06410 [Acidovorax soli]|uniref:GAP1-N1 domain-containing protein n=1 Tax=Acidovorax soli TaxID=592050 RepID=UPI0026F086DE|nr:hypothetical protein [Acidovorax soli]MCM2346267.1 hypothetical protein [Acidovorax soli]
MGIIVQQALHGYSEGHRQFACSAQLTPNDARLVLVMSDASGSGVTTEGIPYLTGYPLLESGLYALARTWPAPEMPRPGCVWTHTLFIEFADLATLDSPSQLAVLFKAPSIETARLYGGALHFANAIASDWALTSSQMSVFERLATALYERPYDQVWARRASDAHVDEVVLRLWDLQWPRLRRSFRFCTLTTRDRSQEGALFDLQFCGESVSRLRFTQNTEGVEATSISAGPWLAQLVDYAGRLYASEFREVLRLLGTEVLGGREAMQAICELQATLARREPTAVVDAIALVTTPATLSGSKAAREMVATHALSRADVLKDSELQYVVDNLDLVEEGELVDHGWKLARHLLEVAPVTLVELVEDERPAVKAAMRAALKVLDAALLVDNLMPGAHWWPPLLSIRPDLAEMSEFWRRTQARASEVQQAGVELHAVNQLAAAVQGLHDEVSIESVARAFGADTVLICIQQLMSHAGDSTELRKWITEACRQPSAVAAFLAHAPMLNPRLVAYISTVLAPDVVPNDYGVDPWLTALTAVNQQAGQLPIELLVYGFQRAMSWRSRSVGPLLCLTFESLHGAASAGVLASSNWQHLRDSLPWGRPADAWDLALRLRRGLVKRCVDTPVAPEDYLALASTDGLFAMILDATWEHWGGKRYLKWVEEVTGDSADPKQRSRSRVVKAYVEKHSKWLK